MLRHHVDTDRRRVASERNRALDLVFELAHVAAPFVGDQPIDRRVREPLDLATHLAVRDVEKVVCEQGDIGLALA